MVKEIILSASAPFVINKKAEGRVKDEWLEEMTKADRRSLKEEKMTLS